MKLSTSLIIILIALIALVGQGCASPQTMFASPDEAVQSLVSAVRANDQTQLKQILGSHGDDLLNSGDDIADRMARERFVAAYDAKHQLVKNDDGSMTLNTGDTDWPFPIPVVNDDKHGKWVFDTDAGKDEIINRRIGRNELDVIQVTQAVVDAQREYAQRDPNGDGIPEYARKFISDPGKKNGLFWKTDESEAASPLGPLVGQAVEEGYSSARTEEGKPRAYHGYHYRILTSQGPNASGGAFDYVVDGKLIGGFAVIAWPAQYGNSGIMTFIVNHQEVVFQKDLGANTDRQAKAVTAFDPVAGWKKTE